MRITKFEAENFKRLRAISIDPDANTVVLGGRNAQGKSSVLDGIMAALSGAKGAKQITRPIRDGEKKARVVVELDDIRVERKWTPSGSTLTVGPKDGNAKFNRPQEVLDRLIGALAFDPLEFALADEKAQVARLIDIVGREAFDEIEAERKDAYDVRTANNREVKSLKARLEALGDVQETERVDIRRLSTELEGAIEIERASETWDDLQRKIEALQEQQVKIAAAAAAVRETVNPRQSEEVRAEIAQADEINRAAQAWDDHKYLSQVLAGNQATVDACTAKIEEAVQRRADLLASAALPVEGLAFDEDGVTLNGVPFRQSSAAERLKVSVGIAMAMNPDLKVICIRDASLLDDDSKMALIALAEQHDYQIWYEVVGNPGEIGVLIEDGEVV